jgi:hypothetical protein
MDPDISGPQADPDGDGHNNEQEFLAGTLPRDGQSVLRITAVVVNDEEPSRAVHWTSASNRIYAVDVTTNLLATPFAEAASGLWAEPPLNGFRDTTPRGGDKVFYRIRLQP